MTLVTKGLTRDIQPAQESQHQQGIARSQRKTSNNKGRHVDVIIGTEQLLTNIVFLIDICLFNICFNI